MMAITALPPAPPGATAPETLNTRPKLPPPPSVAAHTDTVTISAASIKAAKDADGSGVSN